MNFDFNQKNILIAEDDEKIISLFKATFHDTNSNIFFLDVYNNESIVKNIKKNKIDICLVDVGLPHKSGHTLIKEVKKYSKSLPIIAVTSKTMDQDILDTMEIGADYHINKPFNKNVLLQTVNFFLNKNFDLK